MKTERNRLPDFIDAPKPRNTNILALGTLAFMMSAVQAPAATLADFGYQRMTMHDQLALGSRPLVLILTCFGAGGPSPCFAEPAWRPWQDYRTAIFDFPDLPNRSVNGYAREASNGRFAWSPANTSLGPAIGVDKLWLDQTNRIEYLAQNSPEVDYYSNLVSHLLYSGLIDFQSYDANHDGVVTPDELTLVFLNNDFQDGGGASRGGARVRGPAVDYQGFVVNLEGASIHVTLWCHELTHILGDEDPDLGLEPIDLYGAWDCNDCLSGRMTMMSCPTGAVELDPWHKMQLGWSEPWIRSLRDPGIETIPAAQLMNSNAPILLYDPALGTSEFFMLEYRTATSPNGPGYDANVAGTGLAVWHIQQTAAHGAAYVQRREAGPLPPEGDWFWCQKCGGTYKASTDNLLQGNCPSGGTHEMIYDSGSPACKYGVVKDIQTAPGEHGWRLCWRCKALFFGPNENISVDPLGGHHDSAASGDYSIIVGVPSSPGVHMWVRCSKCQGMFFGPNGAQSVCPAGGTHDGSASGVYAMLKVGLDWVVWNEGPPGFNRGSDSAWGGGTTTPHFAYLNGSNAPVRVGVFPFAVGAGSIDVEFLADGQFWVDFNFHNSPELGTFNYPFKTLANGINAVPPQGSLHIKTGSSSETLRIAKAMKLQAFNGPVTVGR